MLDTIQIPVPPLEIQHQFVHEFDRMVECIRNKESDIAVYKSKISAIIQGVTSFNNADTQTLDSDSSSSSPSPTSSTQKVSTRRSKVKDPDDLNTWRLADLKSRCKELKISGYSKLKKKEDLIKVILTFNSSSSLPVLSNEIQLSPTGSLPPHSPLSLVLVSTPPIINGPT